MFENKRKIVIISLIVAVVILLILILMLFFWPKNTVGPQTPGSNQNAQVGVQSQLNLPQSSPDRISEEKSYPLGLKQLAMSFAERYGSYSSDSGFKNLDDLLPFVSDAMAQKMRSMTGSQAAASGTSAEIFQGFTTKALSFGLGEVKSDQASVTVNTQRLTYLGPGKEPNISYRKIDLKFIKVGGEWKVDDASWK